MNFESNYQFNNLLTYEMKCDLDNVADIESQETCYIQTLLSYSSDIQKLYFK